jgi:sec-independent protein translocase protein TatB
VFFDLSLPEIVVLLGLGIVLFGPDRLPRLVADAARFIRQVRAFSESARADLRKELGPEFDGLNLQDLNPKTFVRNNLLAESEQLRGLRDDLKLALPHPLDPHPVATQPGYAPPPGTTGTVEGPANLHEIT